MKSIHIYPVTFIKATALTFLTFLMPIWGLLILTGAMVVADTIFAIYFVFKKQGREHYRSNRLFNFAIKCFFYLGSIILAYMVDIHIIGTNTLFGIELFTAKLFTVFWAYVEFKSIDETSVKLGNAPFLDTIKAMINTLKGLKKDITELDDSENKPE